jgi:AmmeMemoRadiSam system protein B
MNPNAKDRHPALAGLFYPADAAELQSVLQGYLSAAPPGPAPKAFIAPHAGYIYSGPVAASVYARLHAVHAQIRRVILLGPSHRVPFRGLAYPTAERFLTPLGAVRIDQDALAAIADLPQLQAMDSAHAQEHSLEVHLPFLQATLSDFSLVPLVVGDTRAEQVAEVLERLWGGAETLIAISSDLSHYHDYETARRLDRATSDAIEALDFSRLDYDHACGRAPVSGLLLCARNRGMQAETIDLRNSGDTAGSRDRVVGYGAYVFN